MSGVKRYGPTCDCMSEMSWGDYVKASDYDTLRTANQRLEGEVARLRADKERLDAIEENCWDVRYSSSPNGDAGDSNIGIEIVGHWMQKPCERVVGENYSENLRAAIDQAMKAGANPPARPDYDDEIDAALRGNGGE